MLTWVLAAVRGADLEPVVITGHEADQVSAICTSETSFNPHFADGMGTSLAHGARLAPPGVPILVVLGDMPELKPKVIQSLLDAYSGEKDIVVPIYQGEPDRYGHPVLFGPAYKSALEAVTGDEGGRLILKQNQQNIRTVFVEGALEDLDMPT